METHRTSPTGSMANQLSLNPLSQTRQLTDAEKLSKVIIELIETERTYVKVSFKLFSLPGDNSTGWVLRSVNTGLELDQQQCCLNVVLLIKNVDGGVFYVD